MTTSASKILNDINTLIKTFVFVDDNENNIIQTMEFASDIANADGCFFYELNADNFINLKYSNIKSLNSKIFGIENQQIFPSIFLSFSKRLIEPVNLSLQSRSFIFEFFSNFFSNHFSCAKKVCCTVVQHTFGQLESHTRAYTSPSRGKERCSSPARAARTSYLGSGQTWVTATWGAG